MCSCFGSSLVLGKEPKAKKTLVLREEAISFSMSQQLKDVTVRIVHAGGRIEMYENAIPASKLICRYPGMCIARPDVFRHPHESVLAADDILLPGNKYFIIRSTTVEKLKRRHSRKGRNNESAKSDEPIPEKVEHVGDDDDHSEESICTSRDFVVSKDGWSILRKHMKEQKQFVPPIQRPRIWREPEWEPSLTSIQEVSP